MYPHRAPLAAPIGAPELLQRERSGLVQALSCDLCYVLHTLTVAEADDAFARLAHAGIRQVFGMLIVLRDSSQFQFKDCDLYHCAGP